MVLTHILLEEYRQIINHSVATTQLLENLRGRANKHTTEMLGAATGKQVAEFGLFTSRTGTIQSVS